MTSLRASCERVLRENDRGSYTVPSPKLYPNQWAWDSALIAIGWAHLDPARAWAELFSLAQGQWPDGRIPHIQFRATEGDYFPGPEIWRCPQKTSSITQPPVWATCARRVLEIAGPPPGGTDALARLVTAFDASHRFFYEARDPLGWNLVAVAHPWESGTDNSPAWDVALAAIDRSAVKPFTRVDTQVVGDVSMRPTDTEYRGYLAIVKAIAASDFGPGPFAVYDPLMSALLARGEDDLAYLAGLCEQDSDAGARAAGLRKALAAHLWDEARGRFVYVDARTRAPIPCDFIGCYMPLVAGMSEATSERLLAGLGDRFATSFPLPSTAPGDPAFDGRRYWRGPTWININYLLSPHVAGLAEKTIALVEKSGIREYYEPETGEGLGATSFSWTAALTLDLLHRAG